MSELSISEYSPKVSVLQATELPECMTQIACSNSMKGIFGVKAEDKGTIIGDRNAAKLVRYLYDANHMSPFEHCFITFDVSDISRACADQLRTHRMGSFTMSSTHYQDHNGYPHFVSYGMADLQLTHNAINWSMSSYAQVVEKFGRENARQFLPLSIGTRMIWTVNARALVNFLNLRMCLRNTDEMVLLASQVHYHARKWFFELFTWVDCDCQYHECKQLGMRCEYATRRAQVRKYKSWGQYA